MGHFQFMCLNTDYYRIEFSIHFSHLQRKKDNTPKMILLKKKPLPIFMRTFELCHMKYLRVMPHEVPNESLKEMEI